MEMDATSDSASDSTAVAAFALPLADLDLETLDTYIDTSAAVLDFALFRIHVDRGVTRLWGLIRRVGLSLGSQECGHLFPEFRTGDFFWLCASRWHLPNGPTSHCALAPFPISPPRAHGHAA